MFCKKAVHKDFAIFMRKYLCGSLFLIMLQAFRKKRLQRRCFPVINAKFLRTPILKDMQTAASENLSGAAILIFRRYFGSGSLSAFYKIGVLKTSAKFLGKHICWGLFSMKLQTNNVQISIKLEFY